jgi:hypothetical protein
LRQLQFLGVPLPELDVSTITSQTDVVQTLVKINNNNLEKKGVVISPYHTCWILLFEEIYYKQYMAYLDAWNSDPYNKDDKKEFDPIDLIDYFWNNIDFKGNLHK